MRARRAGGEGRARASSARRARPSRTHGAEQVHEDVQLDLRVRAAQLQEVVKRVWQGHRLREHGRGGGKDGESPDHRENADGDCWLANVERERANVSGGNA